MSRWAEWEAALAKQIRGERLAHVYRVLKTTRDLANRYGANLEQAEAAALLHDYCKAMKPAELLTFGQRYGVIIDPAEEHQPHLLHGPVAAAMLQEQGLLEDPAVLEAIRWHTTGRAGMSLLEKVIWLADYIEPGRSFDGVEAIRQAARENLDKALLMALDNTIRYVLDRGWPLHLSSVHARNWLLTV